ncbi:YdaU family protein [Herbaspirillum autotrophicum]|uniref:YdaU family protein n=1 Tax=Herbaspirillum autotrophicum TaxID=180195 RepID=UPI00067C27CF|nr:YdaU family protein [Herbaspirillum autotrophicum]
MNYYEHHIGDYATATSHLSWDEDMAYTRLLRWYYRKEKPIPIDIKEACRQIRATTKVQREAVESVLKEFFLLREDGWHKDTCDEAIAKYQDGEPERELKKANEDNRTKRHREERAKLFKALTDAGGHASWNIGIADLRTLVANISVTVPETKPVTPVTAPATPVTATQTPDTTTHTPEVKTSTGTGAHDSNVIDANPVDVCHSVGEICIAMRPYGINANPGHLAIIELAAQGVLLTTLHEACRQAKAKKPNEAIPPNFVIGFIRNWAADAAAMNVAGARPPQHQTTKDQSRAAAMNSLGLGGHHDEQPFTLDAATGREAN